MALLTLIHSTPVLTPCVFHSGTQGSRSCLPRLYLSLSKATTYPLSTLVGSGSKPYRDERDSKLLMIAPWSGDHVCPWHLSHLEDGFCVVCSLCIVYVVCVYVWCVYVCVGCVYIYKEHEYEFLCLYIWVNVCGMFVTGYMGCSEGIYPVLHACSRQ